MRGPGRNDPCPCGSGRKYKQCCLQKSLQLERALRHAEEARAPLHSFAAEPALQAHLTPAWFRFAQGRGLDEGPQSEAERVRFLDWFQLVYRLPNGETVLERFLRERGAQLPARDQAILEGWRQCMPGVFQVLEVSATGARLADVFRDREVEILSTVVQGAAVGWDLIVGNVIETEGVATLSGAIITLGPLALPRLREFAQREIRRYRRKAPGAGWDEFLRASFERFNAFLDQQRPPKLVTPEGDEICFAAARYDVADPQALVARFAAHPDIDANESDTDQREVRTYTWLERTETPPLPGFFPEPRRSLGWIEWKGRRLSLQCVTPERLAAGKALLADFGDCLRHRADSLQSLQQALAESRESTSAEPTVPGDVEAEILGKLYEDHYARWPDEPVPALGGKTPREAVKTATGRAKVDELLRSFENMSAQQTREGRPTYDFSKLRSALGLERSPSRAPSPGAGPAPKAAARVSAPPLSDEAAAPANSPRAPRSAESRVDPQAEASPERRADVDDAGKAAWAFVTALDQYDESAVRPLLLPGRLADALVDMFGLDALIGVSGWAEPHPEVGSTQIVVDGDNAIAVEFEHFGSESGEPPFPFTVSLQRYRKRWLVDRVLPVRAGEPLDLEILPPDLGQLMLGALTIPPRPTAARDGVEKILLQSLPARSLNVLEQATAMRVWRDFVRRLARTATITPGRERIWAAAVEYTVRVLESLEGSQAAVARAYGTSANTLARSAKQIESVLALEHNDARYVIAPDRSTHALVGIARAMGFKPRLAFGAGRGKGYFR